MSVARLALLSGATLLLLLLAHAHAGRRDRNPHRKCSDDARADRVHSHTLPFRNVSLSWADRVDDLVSRLTLDELVGQLSHGGTSPGSGPAPAIPGLGIAPYSWNTECLRGLADAGPATSFPQALGLAASFDRLLLFAVAEATSKEARAKFDNYTAHGEVIGDHMGISCFSPVVNIMRHPLWGRNQETYGEDPYMSGELGKVFVHGLQGNHPRYIRTNAGCKHFDVHNGPENVPSPRFAFNAQVTERDWRLTFLPAFHGCVVEGGSLSVMCSYNAINGIPACANKRLLTDILRTEWKFEGYVISDQEALENIVTWHKYTNTSEEAAAAALLAGTNLGLSTNNPKSVFTYLPEAMKKGLVRMDDIAAAAKPLFYVRMRLGEFDPPEMNPYTHYKLDLIQSPEHRELSIRAAMESFVLLKNNGFLPLKQTRKYKEIAVVGPMANDAQQLFGNYAPTIDLKYTETPLQGFQSLANVVHYGQGCKGVRCGIYRKAELEDAIRSTKNEFIIVCLGTGQAIESEANDRRDLFLPGKQTQLLEDVIQLRRKLPIILLLFVAGPVQIENSLLDQVDAVIDCFFPAQATGEALRRVLLNEGKGSNPGGRLPFTWPTDISQVPEMTSYKMANRTYRYWNQPSPQYPFGYGLSYTNFSYSNLKVTNQTIKVGDNVTFHVTVENKGELDGDEVMQAYISWLNPPEPMPILQLVAFERQAIPAGKSVTWSSDITANQMAVFLDKSGFETIPGELILYVGGQQPNQQVSSTSNVLSVNINIQK